MKINGKVVETTEEVLQLIEEGVNPLEYLEGDYDIDLVTKAVAHKEVSEDPYWDDMAELLLKAIVHYLYAKNDETKSLSRCKEIMDKVMNSEDKRNELASLFADNESAKVLYKAIEIASDKTFTSILETLNEKLSKIA